MDFILAIKVIQVIIILAVKFIIMDLFMTQFMYSIKIIIVLVNLLIKQVLDFCDFGVMS